MFENHKPMKHVIPHCPQCGKCPTLFQIQFKSGDRCKCRQCDATLTIADKFPAFMTALLILITIPVWLFVLFFALIYCLMPLLPRDETSSIWIMVISAIGVIFWSFAGWPIVMDYVFKRVEIWVPTCHKCGYNLTVMTDNRCPECGTIYDPDFVPFFKRDILQFNFKPESLKFIVIFSLSLFAGVTLISLIISLTQPPYIRKVGWPVVIYAPGIYHGRPLQPWNNLGLFVNVGLCFIFTFVIDFIRNNISTSRQSQQSKNIEK